MAVFALAQGLPKAWLIQIPVLGVLFWGMPSGKLDMGFVRFPVQMIGLLALIPIWFYSGQKLTNNRWVQWGFYLFYPLHLLALYLIKLL